MKCFQICSLFVVVVSFCNIVGATSGEAPPCFLNGDAYINGSDICVNGTLNVCDDGNWLASGPCPNCTYGNVTYLYGDFLCGNDQSWQCQSGGFVPVGNCVLPELVNCTAFNQSCAVTWSVTLSQNVFYCGQNGSILSTFTLCYGGGGAYECANNLTGDNWIIKTTNQTSVGFNCPLY